MIYFCAVGVSRLSVPARLRVCATPGICIAFARIAEENFSYLPARPIQIGRAMSASISATGQFILSRPSSFCGLAV